MSRFIDFRENEILINLFVKPFTVFPEDAPQSMQMEPIDMQCNSKLQEKFNLGLFDFYSKYINEDLFPNIWQHTLRLMSLFRITYMCEQLFSRINVIKSKTRTRITYVHLENTFRVGTSNIRPDIDEI